MFYHLVTLKVGHLQSDTLNNLNEYSDLNNQLVCFLLCFIQVCLLARNYETSTSLLLDAKQR